MLKIGKKKALDILLERVLSQSKASVILAYPKSESDIFLDNFGKNKYKHLIHFSGSDENVLERMYMVAKQYKIDPIIRITHDNILQFPDNILTALEVFNRRRIQLPAYLSLKNGIPGTKFEIFSFDLLRKACEKFKSHNNTEYITYAIKAVTDNQLTYEVPNLLFNSGFNIIPYINLALDYPEDLFLLRILKDQDVFEKDWTYLCNYILKNPTIMAINKKPIVSIYTCAYNAEKTIERTMKSVTEQLFTDWEYIIYNDGSTDKTLETIMSSDNQSKKIEIGGSTTNEGLSKASNEAISQTKGKYILRLDADDELLPNALEAMVERIKEDSNIGIVYADCWKESGQYRTHFRDERHENIGCALIGRTVWEEVKFRDDLKYADGLDFYLRAKKICSIAEIDYPLWIYHQRDDSMSKTGGEERKKIYKKIEDSSCSI